ncbi:prolipoprotein diacylglyceryl transferase [Janibacter sp. GS2]|uniref:prolipoprotein diacylglyceryl transferase n=1 Tax=Janibacter sp. GS2 TaxID=3442646 RepID=UPI003EC0E737
MLPGALPSPTTAVIEIGPLTIHAYALCILAGIGTAIWITDRRLRDRGGEAGAALDVAMWAVPFGIVGGRLYHVITTPQPYFGEGGHPVDALKIWEGGLGIWGAVALGALGAWLGLRSTGIRFLDFADAAAPGVLVAQAIGRWGNWFNNEIFGERTDLPWGLQIHRWDTAAGRAVLDAGGEPIVMGTFHPTFLYESLFLLVLAIVILVIDRRARLAPGQVLGLYVAGYPLGRIVIETMRTDAANEILGLRVNIWTSILVFVLGVVIYTVCGRRATTSDDRGISSSETTALTR